MVILFVVKSTRIRKAKRRAGTIRRRPEIYIYPLNFIGCRRERDPPFLGHLWWPFPQHELNARARRETESSACPVFFSLHRSRSQWLLRRPSLRPSCLPTIINVSAVNFSIGMLSAEPMIASQASPTWQYHRDDWCEQFRTLHRESRQSLPRGLTVTHESRGPVFQQRCRFLFSSLECNRVRARS